MEGRAERSSETRRGECSGLTVGDSELNRTRAIDSTEKEEGALKED